MCFVLHLGLCSLAYPFSYGAEILLSTVLNGIIALIIASITNTKVLIKALAFIGRGQLCFGNRLSELIFKVAVIYPAVAPFLFGIVAVNSFGKQAVIRFTDRLTHKYDIILCSCRVGVLCMECSVVMTDTALSLTD